MKDTVTKLTMISQLILLLSLQAWGKIRNTFGPPIWAWQAIYRKIISVTTKVGATFLRKVLF